MFNALQHVIGTYELLISQKTLDGMAVFERNRVLDELMYFQEYLENRLDELEQH